MHPQSLKSTGQLRPGHQCIRGSGYRDPPSAEGLRFGRAVEMRRDQGENRLPSVESIGRTCRHHPAMGRLHGTTESLRRHSEAHRRGGGLRKQARIEGVGIHDLRHSCASLLYNLAA